MLGLGHLYKYWAGKVGQPAGEGQPQEGARQHCVRVSEVLKQLVVPWCHRGMVPQSVGPEVLVQVLKAQAGAATRGAGVAGRERQRRVRVVYNL